MIASLPMYATPRSAGADARFWAAIRDELRRMGEQAPDTLTLAPPDLLYHWRDPTLVLSQTCGLPYRQALKNDVTLVGTPDYGVKGCPPGHYRSLIIARDDDPRDTLTAFVGARFAYNDAMSQSGWAAMAMEAPDLLRGPLVQTGSHRASALAVRQQKADFAAIDAVTLRHLQANGEATGLKIIHGTQPTPGLPFITARTRAAAPIRAAIIKAIAALTPADSAVLGLRDLVILPEDAYNLPLPPKPQAFAH